MQHLLPLLPLQEPPRRKHIRLTRLIQGGGASFPALVQVVRAQSSMKVGILAALISHPDLLVLDEPFNFLDPSSQNSLKHILTDYNVSTGATVIVSSHNLAHTIDISTRIALLEHGRVIKDLPNGSGADAGQELRDYFDTER